MTELPFLLKLCDDTSPNVREKIARRLRELGPQVWAEIEAQKLEVSPSQRAALEEALALSSDDKLKRAWEEIWHRPAGARQLEEGLMLLCDWQIGVGAGHKGRALLDECAAEFRNSGAPLEAAHLSDFLFGTGRLKGAPAEDYYHPLQSNLTAALENGYGLPITLASVFILVGARLGLDIEGCNFPGHFLARDAQSATIFDPFNGGRPLSRREMATLHQAAPGEIEEAASSQEILARVLRNLAGAYHQVGESGKAQLMFALLHTPDNLFT